MSWFHSKKFRECMSALGYQHFFKIPSESHANSIPRKYLRWPKCLVTVLSKCFLTFQWFILIGAGGNYYIKCRRPRKNWLPYIPTFLYYMVNLSSHTHELCFKLEITFQIIHNNVPPKKTFYLDVTQQFFLQQITIYKNTIITSQLIQGPTLSSCHRYNQERVELWQAIGMKM